MKYKLLLLVVPAEKVQPNIPCCSLHRVKDEMRHFAKIFNVPKQMYVYALYRTNI